MKALVRRISESAVAWSFLGTLLRVGASVFVLPIVLRQLPPEHLAMWYVFGSLGGFAALLDMGFELTVSRMTAYAWAGATQLSAFGVQESAAPGCGPNRTLLRDLLATLRAYYLWVGLAVLLLLEIGGGAWVWWKSAGIQDAATVRGAWVVYALAVSLGFLGGRWPALLGGIGQIRTSQQVTVFGMAVYYLTATLGFLAGFGLWSLVTAALLMGFFVRAYGRHAFTAAVQLPEGLPRPQLHRPIFAAIWPNAWRTGLVSLGTFLILNANTLICSAYLELATTASYGISFQLVLLLVGLSGVWVHVKQPAFNQLRISGGDIAIARLFVSRLRFAVLTFATGSLGLVLVGPHALALIGSNTPLLPTAPLVALCVIQFLEMHHSLYATLVLSENRNPFLKPALLSGIAIVSLSILLTPRLGVWGLLLSAGVVQAAFNNWWTVLRAVRGLSIRPRDFWAHLLWFRDPWKTA